MKSLLLVFFSFYFLACQNNQSEIASNKTSLVNPYTSITGIPELLRVNPYPFYSDPFVCTDYGSATLISLLRNGESAQISLVYTGSFVNNLYSFSVLKEADGYYRIDENGKQKLIQQQVQFLKSCEWYLGNGSRYTGHSVNREELVFRQGNKINRYLIASSSYKPIDL
ncbi:hypothetical protein [Sphingobacterium hungaricum]|uniref:Uncharacterized protein n=1 Tax=Sphingobacterium hungaricum TaxID=2082723 RepID=A0A928YRL3_9SPHI|nr:hypothetical protein [Sphingobacterium hungaricum]MBE8715109.1 hypothetical protein [Sphingobacterium hungaricum]